MAFSERGTTILTENVATTGAFATLGFHCCAALYRDGRVMLPH
jgi:hypothetical protein